MRVSKAEQERFDMKRELSRATDEVQEIKTAHKDCGLPARCPTVYQLCFAARIRESLEKELSASTDSLLVN